MLSHNRSWELLLLIVGAVLGKFLASNHLTLLTLLILIWSFRVSCSDFVVPGIGDCQEAAEMRTYQQGGVRQAGRQGVSHDCGRVRRGEAEPLFRRVESR